MKLKRTAVVGLAAAVVAAVPLAMTVSSHADEQDPAAPGALAGDFYVDPESNPAVWVRDNADNPNAETIKTEIADQPMARWYGDWENTPVSDYVAEAAAADAMPILVAYNMYDRDCSGGHSDGGAESPEAYKSWITDFAQGIGDHEAYVVVEPDALPGYLTCGELDKAVRLDLMTYAVDQLATHSPNAQVYMDAGNAGWPGTPADVAGVLSDVGVDKIRGFALNTANHYTTDDSVARAEAINGELGGESHFVVDTSRNGAGKTDDGEDGWCNPVGATLGEPSQLSDGPADAHLWIKVPGDSDGDCNYGAGIPAGQFSEKLAMALITGDYN